jgi:uncharacterized protein (TIGR02145 family)
MKVCLKITLLLLALLFAGGGVAHVSAQIDKDVEIPKKSTVPRSSPPKKAAKQQNKPKSKPVSKPQIQPPSQEPSKGAKTEDLGMIINGVLWATRNVDEPGTFAASPESAGKFYQWNRKKAWPATGSVSNWDSNDPAGDTWSRANDPSPKGYRLPTSTEIDKLLDGSKVSNEWTEVNGVNGRKFTDKATGASIFLPAAGYRCLIDGSFRFVGSHGHYWSSTGYDSYYAYLLLFHSNNASLDFSLRSDGFSVRPVAE